MGNYSYYYGEEAEQFNFFRLPKKLIRDRRFKSISSDAKILYGVLLDRMSLSIRCGWVDEENRVYIIYTIKDIMEEFECGEKTAIKFLGELGKAGLVEKKRQGQGKPNLLYVKNFNAAIDVEESLGNAAGDSMEKAGEKQDMLPGTGQEEKEIPEYSSEVGVFEKTSQDQAGGLHPFQNCTNVQVKNCTKRQVKNCTNVQPSKTEDIKTEYKDIYTPPSIHPSTGHSVPEHGRKRDDRGDRLRAAIDFFRENLSFDALLADYPERRPELDGILQILAETYCTSRRTVRIGPEEIPADISGGGGHKDNLDVLERYYRRRSERGTEIREQMWRLSEQEEDIRRLWGCFLAIQEPYYGILEGLYVEKRLYADVEKSWGYSHSVFEKTRKEGLCLLADMFNSSYTSVELIRMGGLQGTGKKNTGHGKAKKTESCKGQMELPLGQIQVNDKEG